MPRTNALPDSPPQGFPEDAEPADNSVGGLILDEREPIVEEIQPSRWATQANPETESEAAAAEYPEPDAGDQAGADDQDAATQGGQETAQKKSTKKST